MIKCLYYPVDHDAQEMDPARISDVLQDPNGVVWLDICDPSDEEIEMLREEFGFHELAIEDVKTRDQRPRATEYGDYVFIVAHEIQPAEDPDDISAECVRRASEIHSFVGPAFCVTVHDNESEAIRTMRKRWDANRELRRQGPFALLYLMLDTIVDQYYPTLDAFDDRLDLLEHLVIKPVDREVSVLGKDEEDDPHARPLEQVLSLRRSLLNMRRSVAPLRDGVNVLLRRIESIEETGGPKAGRARALYSYYQDVYDHLIRVVETLDTYRDLLAGTLDAHLAVASNRLNEIVKVLTSVSIILMTWGTITSLYGMNFQFMPELHWKYGYAYALGLMIVLSIVEWVYFRRRKWL